VSVPHFPARFQVSAKHQLLLYLWVDSYLQPEKNYSLKLQYFKAYSNVGLWTQRWENM
jgi:hypothetical protein